MSDMRRLLTFFSPNSVVLFISPSPPDGLGGGGKGDLARGNKAAAADDPLIAAPLR
jgi:hypothetical protein